MKQINGFTMVEMLFALMILSILTLLVVPSIVRTVEKQETNHFFAVLESDILYIQNQALGTRDNVRIVFDEEYYVVISEGKTEGIKRHYPEHLKYNNKINNRVAFNNNGTIINPTTFKFKDRKNTYHLVFPLGKGRHYIEER
ncbi:competence type IV pilus minor pilin ComGD [Pseudogracilibacillus sp. SO30301A]|uniref:competence type IV pilus minor pilin ComGD n=1 Tax=Pseudogracilibacillus sp. SO30301A TaxID=3098291 RepID=UPI00300DF617